jgi:predicted aconitase
MRLTAQESEMLAGGEGVAVQRAMQIVVALAEIYEAEQLVPVVSAQIAGVSYKNLGEPGLEFLEEWSAQGARVRVPAFMNPAGMDLERWPEMGIAPEFGRQQQRSVRALMNMGVIPTCTCTPYLVGFAPAQGEHLAWSESSAVSYANSVLGARTNREGGPSALAAAIVGRTAAYGLHLPRNRQATHICEVGCELLSEADWGALGYWVGKQVSDGVPYLRMRRNGYRNEPRQEHLMALSAAMAASGAVARITWRD